MVGEIYNISLDEGNMHHGGCTPWIENCTNKQILQGGTLLTTQNKKK